ncbi:MAG TPA: arylsulfatase [Bacteroidales bacterium]|nr:arylsulfatase [Bacteroidales bacterium]
MKIYLLPVFFMGFGLSIFAQDKKAPKPNIIIIYTDDLGYGDVGYNGAIGVQTPNIDLLANNGLQLTDGHCSAATSTPSRYSLLTGSYAFRKDAAILPGDAPLLIRPGTPTLPAMLQKAGYTTGVVGKWHLGLGNGDIEWNGVISPGPLEIGFNYSFLVPATLDRVPCVFVENHRVVNLDSKDPIVVNYNQKIGNDPTGLEHPEMLKITTDTQHSFTIIDSISRIGYMSGGNSARCKDEEIADILTEKAKVFINKNKNKPFFLYLAFTEPHVPRVPNPRFKGKSTMGSRGDVIIEMDWATGEIVKTLENLGISKNTMIIFSSDNGPILNDGYDDRAEELVGDHKPGGPYKGGKYSIFEAGTRLPTIICWPSIIKPGVSKALFNQVDFYASLANLVGQKLNPTEAPDSYNVLPVLLGKSDKGRQIMLEEAFTLALRKGNWKYIEPQSKDTPDWLKDKKVETGLNAFPQLFNLSTDVGEQHNVIAQYPKRRKNMQKILKAILDDGGSRPGFKKNI